MNEDTIETASEGRYTPIEDEATSIAIHDGDAERAESPSERPLPSVATESTVLVGVPAYNEAQSIASVVANAKAYADDVLVVDDGSDDDTRERALDAGAKVATHETNMGYGATLGTIFQYAYAMDVDHLVTIDGDGQHDPGDIPKLVEAQQSSGADIVIGSRFADGADTDIPTYRRAGLAVVNALTNAGLRLRYSSPGVSDTQSGFRTYRRSAIEAIVLADDIGTGMGASLDILFQAAREGNDIEEVPTTIDYDIDDPSSQSPLVHGLGLLQAIFLEVVPGRPRRIGAGIALTVVLLATFVLLYGRFGPTVTGAFGLFLLGAGAVLRSRLRSLSSQS
ncbi:glycosyltransferase family 2 protein [Natronomonas amylolytica]|uniref:glycosyltransferase family 2 protein n=1 Tax=Natronomonas amylolytica TaxID=3108498 RepID=UPI00300835B5